MGQVSPEEEASTHVAAVLEQGLSLLEKIPVNGKRILFFTVHGWSTHVAWESVLAMGLRLRGADPRFFLCGGGLSQCDSKHPDLPRVNYSQCHRCMRWGFGVLDALELRYTLLKQVLDPQTVRMAEEAVASVRPDEFTGLSLDGIPVAEYTRPSLTRALGRGRNWPDRISADIRRGFLVSAAKMSFAVPRLLDDIRPAVVVMTNGLFFAERLMFEEALRRGIPVVTYEKGKHLDHIVVARNRAVVRYEMDDDWPVWRDRPLTSEENRLLDESMGSRQKGKVGNEPLWTSMTADREEVLRRLALDPARLTVSLFTNVAWDTSVYGSDGAFPNMLAWVAETIRYFAEHPRLQLVVRIHPAEVRLTGQVSRVQLTREIQRICPTLPPNVRVVSPGDDLSSYTLLALSHSVVVYTSTIGLEAAVAGKPVLMGGRVHYAGRGFTFDAASPEGYRSLLARFSNSLTPDPMSQTLARRYAYLFFHRFMHPLRAVREKVAGHPRFAFNSLEQLMPGMDASLDRICDFILSSADTAPKNLIA